MKLLIVTGLTPCTRSVATVHAYVRAGEALGHEVRVFGDPDPTLPSLPFTTETEGFDLVLLAIQVVEDFPDMPQLAWVLDRVPKERRVLVDLWARYGDTIRVDHDFNHLEKLDDHQGWEWIEAFEAVADTIVQPTPTPMRPNVRTFFFHGFDPAAVARPYASAREAAAAWRDAGPSDKPHGVMYVGNNWHRWDQLRRFLVQSAPLRERIGPACVVGWDWDRRPQWAIDKGLVGIDVDPDLLSTLDVETRGGVRFDEVVDLLGRARFAPVVHRPLSRQLGFVTHRTFETFHADTLPVLMLPRDFVESIYGPAALALTPGVDLAAHLLDALRRPERQWEAVLRTRAHLARHHSLERRFEELHALLGDTPGGRR